MGAQAWLKPKPGLFSGAFWPLPSFELRIAMAEAREKNVYFAKLAEQAERYDEMADYMAKVGSAGGELSVEERNLLSVAYKNAVGSRRAAWRIITSVKDKEESKGNKDQEGSTAFVTRSWASWTEAWSVGHPVASRRSSTR